MYDPIFSKSFNRYERKRFGFCALILCFIIALSFSSSFKHYLHPFPVVGNAVNLQYLSINAEEDMLRTDDMIDEFNQTVESSANLQELESAAEKAVLLNNTTPPIPLIIPSQNETTKKAAMCTVLESKADYCDIEGHIRLDPISSTVFLLTDSTKSTSSFIIQPHPRKGVPHVKNWTLTLAPNNDNNTIPKCTKNHSFPAILFSIGGFSGNHFHDFADILFPLYSTSFHFKRDVHFLATDYKPFWPSKFRPLLRRLTKHGVVDIDHEKDVHCYRKMILGVRFHRELIINTPLASRIFPNPLQPKTDTPSMSRFRQLLRKTYSLKRKNAISRRIRGRGTRPRLLIISRKRTRIITNEHEISRAARKLGYDVVSAEGNSSTEFAQLVNSCDVMMGIHGAGLTNMLFLPDNAVLIQIVPLGRVDIFAKLDFGDPAQGMNIRYLEHNIQLKESSLVQRYRISDPIIRDPISVLKKGWDHFRRVYLDNQNVTLDVTTFRGTLSKALKLLRR